MPGWIKKLIVFLAVGALLYVAVRYGIALLALLVAALAILFAMIEKILYAALAIGGVALLIWIVLQFRRGSEKDRINRF